MTELVKDVLVKPNEPRKSKLQRISQVGIDGIVLKNRK